MSSSRNTTGARDYFLGSTLSVVVGLLAGVVLLLLSDRAIVRLAVLGVMVVLLVTLSVPILKRVLLAIAILEIPIHVDVYLNHDVAIAESNALSGFNLSVTTFVLVALYSLWGAELAGGLTRLARPILKTALPSFVYLATVALSVAAAGDALLAIYEIVILVQALLLFFYVLHYVQSRQELLFVLAVLMVGMIVQSLIVYGLQVLGNDVVLGPIKAENGGGRINGTLGSPNVLGAYFTLLLPVALGLMLSSAASLYRWIGGTAFALGSVALVLSFSRGAWVGYTLAVGLVLFVAWRRRWLVGATHVLLAAVALLLVVLFQDEILVRVGQYDNGAARARLPLVELAFSMIQDAPLLGVGANNFADALPPYVTIDYSQNWISTVHNKYMLVWAETGLVGLLAFLWVFLGAVRTGWRESTRGDRFTSPLALGLVAGLVGNMIHMTVALFHGRSQIQMLWLVIGVLFALVRVGRFDPVPFYPAIRTRARQYT